MILCDNDLSRLDLIKDFDRSFLNPASIDVRIGARVKRELSFGRFAEENIPDKGLTIEPGEFLLAHTEEVFSVPNGYAVELRLKSTIARLGWNHAMAVWIDPGFQGVITLEIKNDLSYNCLKLERGMRFAQAIVHRLSGPSLQPYNGKYQGATSVEEAKK